MKIVFILLLLILSIVLFGNWKHKRVEEIKLNQIQVIGSHNSYKIGIEKPLFDYLLKTKPTLSGLELDVFYDPKGLEMVKSLDAEPQPFDVEQKLQLPGVKSNPSI